MGRERVTIEPHLDGSIATIYVWHPSTGTGGLHAARTFTLSKENAEAAVLIESAFHDDDEDAL